MEEKAPLPELNGVISWLKALHERDDYFDTIAIVTKKQFDSLVKAGFTEDQATRIVAGFASKPDKQQ